MPGPLSDVTILDLTWVLSGPFASMVLCDLGAEVVKVERPPWGDVARTTGPHVNGESAYFFSINRGKQSIAIDLTTDAGKELFLRAVEHADVVMENFTPGTMDRLGLGWDILHARNPRAGLRGDLRLRADRARPVAAGAGHRRAGHGRRDEHHRRAGRAAGAAGAVARRHQRGPVHGGGHSLRAARAGAFGRRSDGRRQHARLPDRGAGERDRAVLGDGRGAGADRHAAPAGYAVPGVPDEGRLHGARAFVGRAEPVGAVLRDHRPRGADR